ncbi:MAG: glycosyltransferase family 2 protein [Gallionellaceae bacterium]
MKIANTFTVVTPNYNMGQYLARTIESVIRNLRPGDQYFVIDGGSTDDSVDIIRSHEQHLSGWVSEADQGYADAIAKGFSRAGGEYLCWINCGDLLLDGALDEARKYLAASGADMIFGDDFYIDEQDKVIFRSSGRMHSLKNMMLFGGWTPLQDACFWTRAIYERIGGIDARLKYAADYDFFLRMSLAGRCEYVPMVFSAFRRHEGQKSIQGQQAYKDERQRCRKSALVKRGYSGISGLLLKSFYWLLVRLRSRVLYDRYRSMRHAGEPVQQLACGAWE